MQNDQELFLKELSRLMQDYLACDNHYYKEEILIDIYLLIEVINEKKSINGVKEITEDLFLG
ncbi:hypothetical protein [Peribacillus deserti]|uniref:Uncharacterized protein n=1 Tax=Peribacillus deserti TaxID=673318 RepID=A0A2N5M0K7_9BACI|nr:hypothetical protein [Peribacillus deserti]PLT27906.1 hypothetical protein CUU66_21485 [Peribacillus deserti]